MGNNHKEYIDNLKLGDLVAFKLYNLDAKMYSGKISKLGETRVEIQTKNGKKYIIEKTNIYWLNTNGRWPKFIMNAFKGVDEKVENETVENKEENIANEETKEPEGNTAE